MYKLLDASYENATLVENGITDSGKPLHTFIINNEKEFNPEKIKAKGKSHLTKPVLEETQGITI